MKDFVHNSVYSCEGLYFDSVTPWVYLFHKVKLTDPCSEAALLGTMKNRLGVPVCLCACDSCLCVCVCIPMCVCMWVLVGG